MAINEGFQAGEAVLRVARVLGLRKLNIEAHAKNRSLARNTQAFRELWVKGVDHAAAASVRVQVITIIES